MMILTSSNLAAYLPAFELFIVLDPRRPAALVAEEFASSTVTL